MKDILVRTGSSLLAAVIGYIVLTLLAGGLSMPMKLAIATALAVCAFAIAAWAAGGSKEIGSGSIVLASNLKGGRATIEDVRADSSQGQDVRIARRISKLKGQSKFGGRVSTPARRKSESTKETMAGLAP